MAAVAHDKERIVKDDMKIFYDRGARNRHLQVGDMVLIRVPPLTGKLNDTWSGSYEVLQVVTPVTYELAVPERRSKKQILHINMI